MITEFPENVHNNPLSSQWRLFYSDNDESTWDYNDDDGGEKYLKEKEKSTWALNLSPKASASHWDQHNSPFRPKGPDFHNHFDDAYDGKDDDEHSDDDDDDKDNECSDFDVEGWGCQSVAANYSAEGKLPTQWWWCWWCW